MNSRKLTGTIIAIVVAIAVAIGGGPAAGGGSNARSAPAAGGASGTVDTMSTSGFAMTTAAGQQVTVTEAAATTYTDATPPTTASAITAGVPVPVLGTTNSTTITATQVVVHPASGSGPTTYTPSPVAAFQQGARPRRSRTVRSRRTTPRDPARSSADQRRTRRPKPRWPRTRAVSSTAS